MKIVIIEDEFFAARRLENMVKEYDSTVEVLAKLESVRDSIDWFKNNEQPDLIFLDIHLDDDLSFAIFKEVSISCPIVFTTATDEMATQAFVLKEIDFLHKPIVQEELNLILEKYIHFNENKKLINPHIFDDIINSK
jgi:two-component system, LytTR family, response regulator LytT